MSRGNEAAVGRRWADRRFRLRRRNGRRTRQGRGDGESDHALPEGRKRGGRGPWWAVETVLPEKGADASKRKGFFREDRYRRGGAACRKDACSDSRQRKRSVGKRRGKGKAPRRGALLVRRAASTVPYVVSRQRRGCRRDWSRGWAGSPAHTRPPSPWAARIPRRRSLRGLCRRCRRKWRTRPRR